MVQDAMGVLHRHSVAVADVKADDRPDGRRAVRQTRRRIGRAAKAKNCSEMRRESSGSSGVAAPRHMNEAGMPVRPVDIHHAHFVT